MTCSGGNSNSCEFVSLGQFIDRSGRIGQVEVLRCSRCGHGKTMPPLPDVSFLYENRESQDYQPDARGLAHWIKDIAFRRQAKTLLRQLGRAEGRILDFGCGSGQFTRVLAEVAKPMDVVGADMHQEPPAELAEQSYLSSDELEAQTGKFDTVLAMHVLEHDDDTEALLSKIVSHARPGGRVVIEVPNIDCFWTTRFGKYWDGWYLPYHRQHFTRASLAAALSNAGLRIDRLEDVTVPTMGRSFANVFGKTNNLFWLLLGAAAHPFQWAGEKLSGRPTAIRAIATKV